MEPKSLAEEMFLDLQTIRFTEIVLDPQGPLEE